MERRYAVLAYRICRAVQVPWSEIRKTFAKVQLMRWFTYEAW
jgi:hypothetical protein